MITYLECSHCGCEAIESDDKGFFQEDDQDKCMTCGMPGHISIDDNDNSAEWLTDYIDGAYCNDPECEDCNEARKEVKK